jgi:hypothetical protein
MLAASPSFRHARRSLLLQPWGELGYMRIVTSKNTGPAGTGNNAVEEECGFGVVDRFAFE